MGWHLRFARVAVPVASVLTATVLCWFLERLTGSNVPFMLLIPAALLAAWYGGVLAGVAALVAGYLLGDYVFIHAPGTTAHHGPDEMMLLMVYGVTTLSSVLLVEGLRRAHSRVKLRNQQLEREITERHAAQQTLAEAEAKYRCLVEESLVGVYLIQDGHFVYVNARLAEIFGYARDEVLGLPVGQLVADVDRDRVRENVRKRETGEMQRIHYSFHGRRKDGQIIDVEVIGASTVYLGRRAVLGTLLDMTERKRIEEAMRLSEAQLREAKEAAEAASRAKDHFLAVLSHELRTPLTPVMAAISMLQEGQQNEQATRETMEMIRRNVEMEARLIDDLLDVTRISRGKVELDWQTLDLCGIVRRAAGVCQADIEARRLHFGVQTCGGPHWVEGDAGRLQQVFWNLIKNAVKFTPNDGCVGVRCYRTGRQVAVEVSDSGVGMEAEALGRVFNAFEQADRTVTRQFGGLGLGLAISKAMVEMHGGTIRAHSDGKGKGATFTVELPEASRQPSCPSGAPPHGHERGQAAEPARPGTVERPRKILMVEDHGDTAKILRRLLSRAGHEVEHAGDAATALRLAEAELFDLIISDLGLPDRSGVELMLELRAKGCTTPGIALTGFGMEEDLRRTREAGFAEHLTKPVNVQHLLKVIEVVTGRQP